MAQETLLKCPLKVSTSHALVSIGYGEMWYRNNGTIHSPQFDLPVVGTRDNQWRGRMKGGPVYTSVVTFEDVLHYCICVTKEFILR